MMHCNKCNSEPGIYDNSKDALAHIMRVHGVDALLGSALKNYFTDYAPGIEGARKHVIVSMSASGAAAVLQRKIAASAEEQEIAFRQAVQKVIDAYGTERSLVESVMLEFTDALGWEMNVQMQQENPATHQELAKKAESLTAGQRNVKFGKYNWRVLDVQNGKALLLTEDVIEERCYHSSVERITWEACELREYLNGAFSQTFDSSERSRIASVANTNPDNPWYGTPGGKNTSDKVFLLSIDEVVKYFGDSGQLRTKLKNRFFIDDQYNKARIAKYGGKVAWWWLRSPGLIDGDAASVYSGGCLYFSGGDVGSLGGGVRPALWLNL